jgi:adenosine deaminase
VGEFHQARVPITIHTDDPACFQTTLTREYDLAEKTFGLPAANSFRYAFQTSK